MAHGGALGGLENSFNTFAKNTLNPADFSIAGNSLGNMSIFGSNVGKWGDPSNMQARDASQTAGTMYLDYYTGGLASFANGWQSQGSQKQLNTDWGRMGQIGAGATGAYNGAPQSTYNSAMGNAADGSQGTMTPDQMSAAGDTGTGGYSPASTGGMGQATSDSTLAGVGQGVNDYGGGTALTAMDTGGGAAAPSLMQQLGSGLEIAGGLFGLYSGSENMVAMRRQREMQQQLQRQQQQYRDQLTALSNNPGSIQNLPGYQAGLTAVERKMASQGFQGSGNMMAELANYGQTAYNNQFTQLSNLAGLGYNPASMTQGQYDFGNTGSNQFGMALNRLGTDAKSIGF